LKQSGADNELPLHFSLEVLDCFRDYSWPGNIRELRNVIERAVALSRSEVIELTDLPEALRTKGAAGGSPSVDVATGSREEVLESAEYSYLTSLLKKYEGNISQAAQQAGLSRQGLHKLLKKHCISASDYRP